MDEPIPRTDIPLPLTEGASQSMGKAITPAVIASVVDDFYARCRRDPVLGPVFEAQVDDWDEHLARIRAFWGAALLRDGGYSGRPLEAHLAIPGLAPEHFSAWLRLFALTVESHSPPLTEGDVALFKTRAGRMANRLMAAGATSKAPRDRGRD